jgi:hypothetical protein
MSEDQLRGMKAVVWDLIEHGKWQAAIEAIDGRLIDEPEGAAVNSWIAEAVAEAACTWLKQRSRLAAKHAIAVRQFDLDFQAGEASDFQTWKGNHRRAAV